MRPRSPTPQFGTTHLEREVGHGVAHRQSEVPMSPPRQLEMGHDTPIPRPLMGPEHRLAQSSTMSVLGGRHPSQPAADVQHLPSYYREVVRRFLQHPTVNITPEMVLTTDSQHRIRIVLEVDEDM